jgi:hypothetical protein
MGSEVRLTPAQAGKVYDRAFAGREAEMHEGHPSWHAFQRFLRAGYGPGHLQSDAPVPLAPGHRYATPEEHERLTRAAAEVTAPVDPELAELVTKGLTRGEAQLVLDARAGKNRPTRLQQAAEGTEEGQHPDYNRLERMTGLARQTGQPVAGTY